MTGGVLCIDDKCPTIWPAGGAQGASWNESGWRALGHFGAMEMRALNNLQWGPVARPGVGMDALTSWGPTVSAPLWTLLLLTWQATWPLRDSALTATPPLQINLQRDPRWGRNQETPSSDPFVLSRYAVAVARGMQEGEDSRYVMVATTFKHFAAYSIEDIHAANGTHITRENFNAVVSDYVRACASVAALSAGPDPSPSSPLAGPLRYVLSPLSRCSDARCAGRRCWHWCHDGDECVEEGRWRAGQELLKVFCAHTPRAYPPAPPFPLTDSINGIPCTASHFLIQETLFDKWGMQGYITSDGGNMITDMVTPWPSGHGWCPFHAPPCSVDEAVALSSAARCAVADGNEYHDHTVSSVSAGLSKLADIKALLTDTFMMRMRLGLFDNVSAADSPYFAYGLDELASPGAAEANAIAAREGLVLLARGTVSGGAPALPFARGGGGETAVIGFAANNTGKFLGNYVSQICSKGGDTCFPSLLESIGALGEAVTFARGCSDARTCADVDVAAAAAAARGAARVVLTLGLDQTLEAEQRDRANVTLPPAQQALFAAVAAAAAGKPFVVVLIHGGAVAVPEVKASSAGIVDAFYPGTQGGPAIAEVLFGIYNPAGKLPVDVYDASYQGVDFLDMSVASLGRTYRYFRGPNTPGGAPLWPFGFGLSYTTFSLRWTSGQPAPLVITPSSPLVTLSVTVTNTGARVGDEVVQLYLVPRASSLSPAPPFVPTRVLVAFARVGGLAPLEARDVPLTIDPREAFMLTSDAAGTRGLVAGEYTLAVSRGVAGDELLALATVA